MDDRDHFLYSSLLVYRVLRFWELKITLCVTGGCSRLLCHVRDVTLLHAAVRKTQMSMLC